MLALAPSEVLLDRAAAGDTRPIAELLPELRAHGVRKVSPNGVLGDPTGASAAEGKQLLAQLVAGLNAKLDKLLTNG
jgi:creatinine amidohydrolase/Fe(II)-dependent formamide hydrolase-like protein